MHYEYRVIPAPKQLRKIKGISTSAELFATTLTDCINREAAAGWEYVRSETLTAEEPRGLFRRPVVVEETMLVFRRARAGASLAEADAAPRGDNQSPSLGAPMADRHPGPALRREAEPMRERTPAEARARDEPEQDRREQPQRERPQDQLLLKGPAPQMSPARNQGSKPPFVPADRPVARSDGAPTPPLLRPVPRHRPDDKS